LTLSTTTTWEKLTLCRSQNATLSLSTSKDKWPTRETRLSLEPGPSWLRKILKVVHFLENINGRPIVKSMPRPSKLPVLSAIWKWLSLSRESLEKSDCVVSGPKTELNGLPLSLDSAELEL
jgi:hypothetical protein